jgi:hypothetical protein
MGIVVNTTVEKTNKVGFVKHFTIIISYKKGDVPIFKRKFDVYAVAL